MILCFFALGLPCLILVLFVAEVGLSLSKLGKHNDLIQTTSTKKKK